MKDIIEVDKEVIARYVKEFLKYGDPSELANHLMDEVKHEQDDQAIQLLEYAIRTIRNQAQGIE